MSLPRVAIRRPVAVTACALALAGAGLVSALRLPIDLLPDLAYPELVARVAYANAAPVEVERLVTEHVERSAGAVAGVERVSSVVRAGTSTTTLRFAWGTDMDLAALAVRERLDDVRDLLPAAASRPAVLRSDPSARPLLTVVLSRVAARSPARGAAPASADVGAPGRLAALRTLGDLADAIVRRRLEQLEGVAEAALTGVPEREVHVVADAARLTSLGLTMDDVAGAIAASNQSAAGGTIRRGHTRLSLRALGELADAREIAGVTVRRAAPGRAPGVAPGAGVAVRDVAAVVDGFREPESVTRLDGRDAVALLVHKEPSANAVEVARRVDRALADLRRVYPDVRFEVASSQAGFVRGALSNVAQEVVLGGVLAFAVLFLFLREPRVPVAIALVIPVSLLVTLVLLDAAGVSLNVMTLGGLALGVGLLMDNSIVVAENVLRLREQGVGAAEAAAAGAEEVQSAVASSTLTTIAVFAPVAYVEGVAGRLFGALALSVAFALLASVLVALTLLPAMAARWPVAAGGRARPRALRSFDRAFAGFARGYERALVRALAHRGAVVALCLAALGLAAAVGGSLDRTALPAVDEGTFRVHVVLAPGTSVGRTAHVAARIDSSLRADPDVASVFTHVGQDDEVETPGGGVAAGAHVASLDVTVLARRGTRRATERLRRTLAADTLIGRDARVWIGAGASSAMAALLGGGADFAVQVRGPEPDVAAAHAAAVARRLRALPSLTNVRLANAEQQREVHVDVDRERSAAFGLDPREVAHAIGGAVRGVAAGELVAFDRRVPMTVHLPDSQRRSLAALRAMDVRGVPLRELARVREVDAATEVRREGHARVAIVLADVARDAGGLAVALRDVRGAVASVPAPAGLRVDVAGAHLDVRRGLRALAVAFALAFSLAYLILAAEFESVLQPLTVLLSVPLALVGAVLALWVTGTPVSTVSLVGVVVLVGIVDNDAVVKVDCINRLRAQGMGVRDAVLAAGRARLRPIVINTVTALLGLLPMALGWGPGAELQAPLAVTVFGGLLSATALTLIVIPVVYTLVEDARAAAARLRVRTLG